jgi:hypothetical protein
MSTTRSVTVTQKKFVFLHTVLKEKIQFYKFYLKNIIAIDLNSSVELKNTH